MATPGWKRCRRATRRRLSDGSTSSWAPAIGARVSLNGAIASLSTGTYTVTRTAAGTRVLGRYTPGATSTFTILAGIEPATGRQLRDLPEGRRGDETICIYATDELKTTTPTTDPDVVTYRGEPWTVVQVKVWEGFGETHYECLAQRAPSPAGVVP